MKKQNEMSHLTADRSLSCWKFCVICECSAVLELGGFISKGNGKLRSLGLLDFQLWKTKSYHMPPPEFWRRVMRSYLNAMR